MILTAPPEIPITLDFGAVAGAIPPGEAHSAAMAATDVVLDAVAWVVALPVVLTVYGLVLALEIRGKLAERRRPT